MVQQGGRRRYPGRVDTGTLLLILVPFLGFLVVALGAFALMTRQAEAMARRAATEPWYADRRDRPPVEEPDAFPAERPWWGNPWVWLAAGAAFLVLGLVVAPKLVGGIVLFLPFIWIGGWRRRRS